MWLYAGDEDAVGNNGKGVTEVYEGLKAQGLKEVTITLYHGARHEVHNEALKEELFRDIIDYLDSHMPNAEIPTEKYKSPCFCGDFFFIKHFPSLDKSSYAFGSTQKAAQPPVLRRLLRDDLSEKCVVCMGYASTLFFSACMMGSHSVNAMISETKIQIGLSTMQLINSLRAAMYAWVCIMISSS